MSQNVSNKLVPFVVAPLLDNSENMLPDGHRLSVVRWKTPKDQKENASFKARPAICVAVPTVTVTCEPVTLQDAMQIAIAELQDNVVRSVINDAIDANTAVNLVGIVLDANKLTATGIADWSREQSISGRLSKETIGGWFDSKLETELGIKLAEVNVNLTSDQLEKAIAQHKKLIMDLASPKANMPEQLAKQLQKAINLVSGDDKVKSVLNTKLDGFIKPKEVMLEIGLGL